jgi:uncharacterized membrane protein
LRPGRLGARLALAFAIAALAGGILVPTVAADDGLEVTTPFTGVVVAPGSSPSFDLTVSSVRRADVSLTLSGVPTGWSASLLGGGFVVDSVAVTPSTDGEVRLDVDVPADATATGTIRVVAEGGGARDVLSISIRVNEQAAGDIALTTDTPTLTGSSDSDFSFDLTFNNDTAQDVTLAVSATGDPGWVIDATLTGETQAASTVVEAGATQAITVSATPPADAAAGTYPITVTADASGRQTTADLGIEVTGSYALTLATPTGVLSTSGSAGSATTQAFTVTNGGTAPVSEVALTATAPTGWEVTVDPETVPTIAPGDVATITATITPSGEAVAGDYAVSFSVKGAEGGTDDTAEIRFTVETSPIWAFVGLGIIVLILAGLFYVFRTYGRR